MRLQFKKEQKPCYKPLHKGHRLKHLNLRVQGIPLASDGAYDKHDAQLVSHFTYILSRSVFKLLLVCNDSV